MERKGIGNSWIAVGIHKLHPGNLWHFRFATKKKKKRLYFINNLDIAITPKQTL